MRIPSLLLPAMLFSAALSTMSANAQQYDPEGGKGPITAGRPVGGVKDVTGSNDVGLSDVSEVCY